MEANVEQDSEIPMLTVVKNNAILKNIFLLNSPDIHRENSSKIRQDLEQTLLVGRHPDCQIRLEHPSISRFHFQIHIKRSLKRLSITDLSSVHGTWISGKRIETNVRVDVIEGDALRIGLSSRVYMLHWIPYNKACDLNDPVIPPPDEEKYEEGNAMETELESANSALKASNDLVSDQFESSTQMEDVNVLLCNNDDGNVLELECESKDENALVCKNEDAKIVDSVSKAPLLEATKDQDMQCVNLALQALLDQNSLSVELGDMEEDEEKEGNSRGSSTGPLRERVIDQLQENEEDKENSQSSKEIPIGPALTSHLIDNLDGATTALFVDEASHTNEDQIPPFNDQEDDGAWSFWFLSSQGIATENNFINSDDESQGTEGENARKERNILEDPTCVVNESLLWSFWSGIPRAESVYSSSFSDVEVHAQIDTQLTNESLQFINPMEKLCKSKVSSPDRAAPSIWSRRGQSTSAPQIQTNQIDHEDRVPNGARIEPITRALFIGMDHPEGEYFITEKANYTLDTQTGMVSDISLSAYSNKENQTPKFLQGQKSSCQTSAEHTKMSVLAKREAQRTPLQTLFLDSPQKSISETHISGAVLSIYSNKENQTPKKKSACLPSAECTKMSMLAKREAQRMPLQALYAGSPQKTIFGTHISGVASLSGYSNKGEYNNNSNKENLTAKFLQEQKSASHSSAQRMPCKTLFVDSPQKLSDTRDSFGLSRSSYGNSIDKNNYLVRRVKCWTMAVDDVNCLLDKNSRKALQLLEGIKGTQLIIPRAVVRELDFMKQQANIFRRNTEAFLASQWIEECLARTKWWIQIQNSMNDYGKSTEDQLLNYALFLRSIQNDKQLILLSDDATRKIKAMEEGLICESAEEFRESLMNPFSKRFMWADSSPRGQTWSCLDDVILRNHFYHHGSLKTALKGVEECAEGLKLILLM